MNRDESKLKVTVVIPARMESSRFPGKPMAKILGLPMIVHCLKRSSLCREATDVVVATCNQEILEAIEGIGGKAVMTSNTHVRCTDRVMEAVSKLKGQSDIIVIVQGDEPMIVPEMISEAVGPLIADKNVLCTNLAAPIESDEEFLSPNTIKVVVNTQGNFLYMSRQPIPYPKLEPERHSERLKQVCVMGFRPAALEKFVSLKPTAYEVLESIDMNRFLENNIPIRCVRTRYQTFAVDTPADLKRVESLMAQDSIARKYL